MDNENSEDNVNSETTANPENEAVANSSTTVNPGLISDRNNKNDAPPPTPSAFFKMYETASERGILGAMLINEGEVMSLVKSTLNESDFYHREHRILFRHIMNLHSRGVLPNFVTVREELERTGAGNSRLVGTLFELANLEFTTAYVSNFIEIVKEKSQYRKISKLAENLILATKTQDKVPAEILTRAKESLDLVLKGEIEPRSAFTVGKYIEGAMSKEIEKVREYAARKTGFANIDARQVFTPGVYVIGALSAAGKTTFAWQLLYQLALNGESCVYCSYEMSKLELTAKLYAMTAFKQNRQTSLTSTKIIKGMTDEESEKELKEVEALLREQVLNNFIGFELHNETIDDLLRLLSKKRLEDKKSPVVCIDYLQIIPTKQENVKSGIDDIVRKLKDFQRETNTTFIVISSFNRANYSQSATFESFKESGNIEYSADVVWALELACMSNLPSKISEARETIEQAKREQPRKVQLRCLKNRKGTNYDCFFDYYAAHDYFEPCESEVEESADEENLVEK